MIRHFDEELDELKKQLFQMGGLVEEMIHFAVKALAERNEGLADEVFRRENEVNKIQLEIDDRCLKLIALHQPAAIDLRFITSAMKINSDLERMGDQAINIIETSVDLLKQPPLKPLIDIPKMAEIAKWMVKSSLESFIKKDECLARSVLLKDDEVDNLKDSIFKELLELMAKDPKNIVRALDLILISRNLERIGDHATNISEDVVFMIIGKDIRHHCQNNN